MGLVGRLAAAAWRGFAVGSESVSLGPQSTTREPDQEGYVNSQSSSWGKTFMFFGDWELTYPSWSGWLAPRLGAEGDRLLQPEARLAAAAWSSEPTGRLRRPPHDTAI